MGSMNERVVCPCGKKGTSYGGVASNDGDEYGIWTCTSKKCYYKKDTFIVDKFKCAHCFRGWSQCFSDISSHCSYEDCEYADGKKKRFHGNILTIEHKNYDSDVAKNASDGSECYEGTINLH